MSSLPPHVNRAIKELALREAGFVEKAYGKLADTKVTPSIVQVYKRIDELMSKSQNSIACREGCNYCCHYHVYCTPLEIFTIAEHIKEWPEKRRQDFEHALSWTLSKDAPKEVARRKVGRQARGELC